MEYEDETERETGALETPSAGLCGQPKTDGRKCRQPAGKGVEGTNYGPCYEHRQEPELTVDYSSTHGTSTITAHKVAAIESTIRSGGTVQMAVDRAGISRSSFDYWFNKGKEEANGPPEERGPYFDFFVRVSDARVAAKQHVLDKMEEAGADDWRMWERMAEMKYPGDFSEAANQMPQDHEVTHTVDEEISDEDKEFLSSMFGDSGEDGARSSDEPIDVESTPVEDDGDEREDDSNE